MVSRLATRITRQPAAPSGELPIEGTDPTVYFVPETADESQLTLASGNTIPDSKVGSGKVQLAAKKLALRVGFSAELVEDSIVPVLNLYREQAMRAIADSIDYVLLNGDTEGGATGNINSDNGAPAANARYMAFNGLRKLPLVTNTANRVDASNAAPTLALLRQARFTMAARYAARPGDLAWIVDNAKKIHLHAAQSCRLSLPSFSCLRRLTNPHTHWTYIQWVLFLFSHVLDNRRTLSGTFFLITR